MARHPADTTTRTGNGPLSSWHVRPHRLDTLCAVPPHPDLLERLQQEMGEAREGAADRVRRLMRFSEPHRVGLNDGLIFPGTYFPLGTTAAVARNAALERAPLRGTVRVVVVLVDFSDKAMTASTAHFEELFFSTGVLPNGSVKEYFTEVSNGLITLTGQVVGPLRMPQTVAAYAGSDNGLQAARPNARDMANDAAAAADPVVNFAPYDNDGNGFVDAFIVVHAGSGAEATGAAADIWSHKWVLPAEYTADSTKIFAYLTIPEDAKIGVCAHELGHLLFGWPDLYDTDYSSAGVGNWCLMAGGSWGGGGDVPVHPSAWCKVTQGWVTVDVRTSNAVVSIPDVKDSRTVYRLWKDGAPGNEYFLVENRQQSRYDASLPAGGLLIWHIDDAISGNSDENHPRVALEQADGQRHLETNANRGDAGDPYPGSAGNTSFNDTSTPNSKSYAGASTCVAVTEVSAAGPTMTARLSVRCFVKRFARKELIKEKDLRENKRVKDIRDKALSRDKAVVADKTRVQDKGVAGDKGPVKEVDKPVTDKRTGLDKPTDRKPGDIGFDRPGGRSESDLEARVAELEALVAALTEEQAAAEPFIAEQDRPDLGLSAYAQEDDYDELRGAVQQGSVQAKRIYDSKPAE